MGGGAMSPAVSGQGGAAAYCSSTVAKPSTAVTTTNIESLNSVSAISSQEPFNNNPSTGISCMHHENVGSPVDGTSGTEYGAAAGKCCSGCVFGPAPSRLEVEKAMTDLQRFLHGEEAKSNFRWLQPIVYPSDSRMLQSPGYRRIQDAFGMLQREPSVQNLVASISCDKAVWDAILNNRAVQDLGGSISAEQRTQASSEQADIASLIFKWILEFTISKIMDVVEKIGLMMAELFIPGDKEKPTSELTDLVEEKIRSSLLLSVVILLIVVVTRNNGA
ncbi:uncharacterized protein [Coffea arabica]|uniref:Uncharacterized protein isoform X2 n=1 Tax=Coffea arabica TaxID=13443 RepID=A0A6P6WD12_COFAR|nr:uncharacterized protein LOC113731741 [Coffea arabica]